MAFPDTNVLITVELALGADLTDVPSNWTWTDITSYVRFSPGITIQRGRGDEFSSFQPCRVEFTVDNRSGRFCSRNPTGAYYPNLKRGTPVRVRAKGASGDPYVTRVVAYIDELPVRWDKTERNATVPITASGVLRRLQQGAPLRSAAYRAHALQPYAWNAPAVAYWPCEDESSATSIASAITGGTAMAIAGDVNLGGDSSLPGSGALASISSTATTSIAGAVPAYASATSWAVRAAIKIGTEPAAAQAILRWHTGGTLTEWQLVLTPGSPSTLKLEAYTPALAEQLGDGGVSWVDTSGAELYGSWVYYQINATQNGTSIDWDQTFSFGVNGFGTLGTEPSVTIGNVVNVGFGYGWGSGALSDVSIGHIAVSTDTSYPQGVSPADILDGLAGETPSTRFTRLAVEEHLSWDVLTGGTTTLLGAQQSTSIIGLFQAIEQAEEGEIFDGLTGDLTLMPHEYRQNRAVSLTIDKSLGQVAEPPEPTDDDQQLRNDVTASRIGGSSARYADAAHIAANGGLVYADSVSVNLADDSDLPYHAQWRVNLGTVDDLRYPRIDLNFAGAPELLASWLTCDIGSRVQVLHPPSTGQPDTIDVHIEGYTEFLSPRQWTVTLNTSPALPWQVLQLEASGNGGRLDTAGSYLLSGQTSGATSARVGTRAGPLWSTTAPPYDWELTGERVTVTAVSNVTASFVAAGTAQHADNASVTPGMPVGVQQDDLLLVFAAIRSSGTGTVNTPTGYTALLTFGNVVLLAKIHSGTESAPAITFSGGAAGDTTSAQMAAFRGVQALVDSSATQLNGSAQDIAVPTMTGPTRPNTVFLWLGWKQDDWTSVATIPGGFATEIGEPSSTTGNDQGLVWDYFFQGNAGAPGSTSFVVTGGAAAISRSAVLALVTDVQTATITRAVNGVSKAQTASTAVALWRPGVTAL